MLKYRNHSKTIMNKLLVVTVTAVIMIGLIGATMTVPQASYATKQSKQVPPEKTTIPPERQSQQPSPPVVLVAEGIVIFPPVIFPPVIFPPVIFPPVIFSWHKIEDSSPVTNTDATIAPPTATNIWLFIELPFILFYLVIQYVSTIR